MDKPNTVYPKSPLSSPQIMPQNIPDPSLSRQAFDQLLQNRGIRFIHKIATHCPNMSGIEENNHRQQCPVCDNSGLYYPPDMQREIWGVFTSNTLEKMFEIQGVWEIGASVITFPTEYPLVNLAGAVQHDGLGNPVQAEFGTYDHLVCPDFQVRLNDLKEYEPTTGSTQTLRYDIVHIEKMYSVVNNIVKNYVVGTDFNITNGKIVWITGRTPTYDSLNDKGEVLSITYLANPVFSVKNVLHELRITQEYNMATGQKTAVRLPQQVYCMRDFLLNSPDNAGKVGSS